MIAIEQAYWHLLRPAGGIVEQNDRLAWWATRLYLHPGLTARLTTRLFQHLDASFVAVNDLAAQHAIAHQVQQRLEVFTALNDPTRQRVPWYIDAMTAQDLFETMKGKPSTYLVVSSMANTLGLTMLFSINWAVLSAVTGAASQSRQP